MRSFFRYPGGKHKLSEKLVAEVAKLCPFPEEVRYCEPFLGGGSAFLTIIDAFPFRRAWINDKDVGIASLWTAVMRYPEDLCDLIRNFIPSVEGFFLYKENLLDTRAFPETAEGIVNLGFTKLALHQMSYSGLGTKSGGPLGGKEQKSKYHIGCRWSPKYLQKKVRSLHKQMSNLTYRYDICTATSYEDFFEVVPEKQFLYLDPPYFVKGNDLYQEGFDLEDHVRLAELLEKTSHSWLLSYDDAEEIRDLYNWATVETIDLTYSITATKDAVSGERKSRVKTELLISPPGR